MTHLRRFAPEGAPLALAKDAYGVAAAAVSHEPPTLDASRAATISIRGPLMHHRDSWFDSYEAILERMDAALAQRPSRVVLDIDSPGGLAAGCFDCSRDLRRMAAAAGVELVARVRGQATSAAYALATAASRIEASPSSTLGSIGVIGALVDATRLLGHMGLRVELVTSGDRKGDGHLAKQIDDGPLAAAQAHVNGLAEEFFELVSEHGYGGTPAELKALEARIVLGKEAVALRLATSVGSGPPFRGTASHRSASDERLQAFFSSSPNSGAPSVATPPHPSLTARRMEPLSPPAAPTSTKENTMKIKLSDDQLAAAAALGISPADYAVGLFPTQEQIQDARGQMGDHASAARLAEHFGIAPEQVTALEHGAQVSIG